MKKVFSILFFFILGIVICEATNRALLIGIGNYDRMKTGWTFIHGDKDVEWLKKQEDLYWSKTYEEKFEDKHTQLSFTEDLKNFFEENNIKLKEDE